MMHAKAANLAPRALADLLLEHLPRSDSVQTTEIAGPGFINVRLAKGAAFKPVIRCLEEHNQFDFTKKPTSACKLNLSQPTNRSHCTWGTWCCLRSNTGELAKGSRASGWGAEYYVNDAGRQMNILAVSVFIRYLEKTGESIVFPSAGYQGDYISSLGVTLFQDAGNSLQVSYDTLIDGAPTDSEENKDAHIDRLVRNAKGSLGDNWLKPFNLAPTAILDDIKDDLSEFGADFDEWFSEKSLVTSGEIDRAISTLEERGHLYKRGGAIPGSDQQTWRRQGSRCSKRQW